jgi:hypothetical protein
MAKRRLFKYLAAASGYTGLGLILGYVLSDQATNTPLWIGVVLAFLGAVLIGMFISSTETTGSAGTTDASDQSSSGSPSTGFPRKDT